MDCEEPFICGRCESEVSDVVHVKDGGQRYCCQCCWNILYDPVRVQYAIEFVENVSGPAVSEWHRAFRALQLIVKFVTVFAACFAISVVQLQPFRANEGVIAFAIVLLLGLGATPIATASFIGQSRRVAVPRYPLQLRVGDGALTIDTDGVSEKVALNSLRIYEDAENVFYPQTRTTAVSQLYLCTRRWLIACGATSKSRSEWDKLLQLIDAKKVPGTSLWHTSILMIIGTVTGKAVGVLFGIAWKGDVFGGLLGCLLGFVISRFWRESAALKESNSSSTSNAG